MRLTDADELLRNYQTICKHIRCYNCQFNGDWGDKGCQLEALIEDAPTVDAEPVKHGHWIDIDSESYTWKVSCSECGHERSMMSTQGTYPKHCEECGAKMDEVTE